MSTVSTSSPLAETMMMGTWDTSRMDRQTSTPDTLGNIKSSRTTSNRPSRNWSRASAPSRHTVTKPYRLRELVARIRAVRRRRESRPGLDTTATVLESGVVRLDLDARRCFVAQQEVTLRRKEFDLLEMLLENAGRVVTRDALIDQVWGSDYVGDTKTLDVHIKRLRSLLEPDKESTLITTVRGVGYRFEVSAGR